jgi:hypothetical protein
MEVMVIFRVFGVLVGVGKFVGLRVLVSPGMGDDEAGVSEGLDSIFGVVVFVIVRGGIVAGVD